MGSPTEATRASLSPLFHPRAIAVYGASSDPTKIGGRPLPGSSTSAYCQARSRMDPGAGAEAATAIAREMVEATANRVPEPVRALRRVI